MKYKIKQEGMLKEDLLFVETISMTKYDELSPWLISMKILSQKNVHKLNYIIVNFTQNNEVSVYIKNKKLIVYQSLILNDSDEQNGTTGGYTP